MPRAALISVLARSLAAGAPEVAGVEARAARTLGRRWRWIRPLAVRYVEAFGAGVRPRHRDVIRFLVDDPGFRRARAKYRGEISIEEWIAEPQRMQPVAAARPWGVPAIETAGDLADWLSLSVGELEWLADLKGLCRSQKLRHYWYRVLLKRSGGVRLIESPKKLLKEVQWRVLTDILDRIPPHPAAHGFVKGRSIVSFAAPHAGRSVVLRLDLQDFFPGYPAARVQALFRTAGYPDSVASLLAGVCTNRVDGDGWGARPAGMDSIKWYDVRQTYAQPHLPQGAPTSPALANLMAYRLDCRLAGLARSAGATYTRYADDLAFSGGDEFSRGVERFAAHAAAITLEEGFSVNFRKTRMMRQGGRQEIAGLVVNRAVAVRRRDVELLEAILTNCVRLGAESQNRAKVADFRAHLEGRIGFVEMVDRGKAARLRELFDGVDWTG